MAWFVQHHPVNEQPILEAFDTQHDAESRHDYLKHNQRIERVVVFEANVGEDTAA